MSILKILPSAIDATANYTFGRVISNGVDLGATVAAAYNAANTVTPLDSYARQTANAAFESANTKLSTSGGTITGNLIVNTVTANTITANGVDLGVATAAAFVLANSANRTTTSDTAPTSPRVGDIWYDTVMNVSLRYTNDGVSNNWIDISGPQNAGFIFQSYSLSSNTTSLNESGSNTSVALTVSTINIADGTTLYWTISGSTGPDFTDGSNSGSVNITNNSGTIIRTLVADVTTEGAESFVAQLRTGSTSGPIVAIAPVITVADTSISPNYNLYAVGGNGFGQLGTNNIITRSSPVQVGSDTTWRQISAGNDSGATAAIKVNGSLWTWGENGAGSLGLNDVNVSRSSPTQVGSGTTWSKVITDISAVFATKTDGTLWVWGLNNQGNLGLNVSAAAAPQISSPTQVGTLSDWNLIHADNYNVIAVKTNGTLWTWGSATAGQSGKSDVISRSSPAQVGTLTNWSLAAIGNYNAAAIKNDGTLWLWGRNNFGSLGNNNTLNTSSPIQIGSGTNWSKISVSSGTCLAIKTDGTLWAWGRPIFGPLGLNNAVNVSSPTQVGSSNNWSQVQTKSLVSAAIKTDGTLWGWGGNFNGLLGLDNRVSRSSPVQIGTGTQWNNVSIGGNSILVTSN